MAFFKEQWDRFINRCVWSWQGWAHVWANEPSLKQWIVANCISTPLAIWLPLGAAETAILVAGGILVLAAECMNTAIERVVDDISRDIRDAAKFAKDAASAAVAITGIAVGAAWVIILIDMLG
ncbi:MAG: diacylglycerol kinase [Rhodobacteraceae bacterium]|jgi:diacylglycerol kinase (ATP)|nr:diacylglycerol kinase [Paracoccaceae bacterium]